MPLFTVVVEETVVASLPVDAPDEDSAAEYVRAGYRAGDVVLEPGECQEVRLCVMSPDGTCGAWEEL